jgi:hypothetical protein
MSDVMQSIDVLTQDVVVNPVVPSIGEFERMRDRITIDARLQAKLDKELAASDALIVTLVARVIEHAPGFELRLPGYHVRLIASSYDARGGSIDVSGHAGDDGHFGATGVPGIAFANTHRKGGAGGAGTAGGHGDAAGTIHVICEQLHDLRLRANGGPGGKGGDGGTGGRGGDGRGQNPKIDGFDGTGGGPGGRGGAGGAGGAGGGIDVEFVSVDNAQTMSVQAAGGTAGPAGAPGKGGKKGAKTDEADGARGAAGSAGVIGAAGQTSATRIDGATYWKHAAARLGVRKTAAWADYRLEAGVYFYRLAKPDQTQGPDMLQQAMAEFDAILHLRPGDANATRYQRQIMNGQNVLGLSRTLDIIPDFAVYFADYKTSVDLVSNFFSEGIAVLLAADNKNGAIAQLQSKVIELRDRVTIDIADRDAAARSRDGANEAFKHALARVDELTAQIRVAAAKTPDTSISIGTIVSTVGLVGGAVASVIAAVPTAGTSLFALAPALAGLTVELSDVSQHVFEATKVDTDALKKQYAKVGKNIDDVVKGVKSVINLADAIKKLTTASTDNTEIVALMRQAAEASYELLLARLHNEQADLTLTARTQQVASDTALVALAETQLQQLKADVKVFQEAGRSALLATQRRADALLTTAFLAQRSVEIYTLRNESAHVNFDSGYVSPDVDHEYADGDMAIADLVSAYTASWLQFLNPFGLRDDYTKYFNSDGQFDFGAGIVVVPISEAASLDVFRTRKALSFSIDLAQLPANHFEAKVQAVHVALVGAMSTKGVLNCRVRHGGRYLMRSRDGQEADQLLEPHVTGTDARFTPLQPTGTPVSNGMSGELNLLSFWGRGVGGEWEVSVEPGDLLIDHVDLSGLSEIQVWIATQAFIRVS